MQIKIAPTACSTEATASRMATPQQAPAALADDRMRRRLDKREGVAVESRERPTRRRRS